MRGSIILEPQVISVMLMFKGLVLEKNNRLDKSVKRFQELIYIIQIPFKIENYDGYPHHNLASKFHVGMH